MRRHAVLASLVSLCAACGAPAPAARAPSEPAPSEPVAGPPPLLRVHMDVMQAGHGVEVEVERRVYRGWVLAHVGPAGEPPTHVVRLDADRYWTIRTASSLDDVAAQNELMAATDAAIRAAVGDAAMASTADRLHARVEAHHNELLRLLAEQSAAGADGAPIDPFADGATLQWIVIDDVSPQGEEPYAAALDAFDRRVAAAGVGAWRTTYWSAYGSGARVHFIGAPAPLARELVDDTAWRAATRAQAIVPAARLPELGP